MRLLRFLAVATAALFAGPALAAVTAASAAWKGRGYANVPTDWTPPPPTG